MFSGLRREFISGMDTNRSRIEGLEMAKANFDGKLASWGIVLTILTVAVNVVSGYLSHGMK
jgi:TRAP-type mannitol/chloroaromatic compound transport system permease small subunit